MALAHRDLPDDFRDRYESIWVTPPNDELCHSGDVAKYLHWNLDDLGFDGLGLNEHHQNGYGFPISPNMIATVLARRKSKAALVVLGNTLPLYNPPIRVAEEFALLDCLSGGRLVAGFPVGSPMDTTGCYGIPPTQVRPRYYEAHDLIKQAWTRPGPFAFNGRFNKLRYVNPWPKPLQKPHPPIWLAGGGSVETWKFATDHDYTYSYLSFMGHK
jgi:alkanesulfonate monooxygenase SsuD/methylene tetrahydromethanopterin reductase-like flavin-dependent oxidoreductase (luciferase family)